MDQRRAHFHRGAYIGGVGGYTATSSAGGNAVTLYLGITSASGTNPNPTVLTGPGTLDLSAGTLTIANAAYFGYASTGTVTVLGHARCLGGGHTAAYIGGSAAGFSGVQGTVNVNAAGAKLSTAGLEVGQFGPGYLNVTGGGAVSGSPSLLARARSGSPGVRP